VTRPQAVRVAVLTAAALIFAAVLADRLMNPAPAQALAFTECSWADGPLVVMVVSRIAPEDTAPVRAHEGVHADQCDDLGFLRYRLKNLTVTGRLRMEAPGYCAGARVRLRRGDDSSATRERMFDDMGAMFLGQADSSRVNQALRDACPELARNLH
jgi:hypothetical protein